MGPSGSSSCDPTAVSLGSLRVFFEFQLQTSELQSFFGLKISGVWGIGVWDFGVRVLELKV